MQGVRCRQAPPSEALGASVEPFFFFQLGSYFIANTESYGEGTGKWFGTVG